MRAIISDLQRAVFQVADERLVAVANIVRVDNKKRRKPTFLCLTGLLISSFKTLFPGCSNLIFTYLLFDFEPFSVKL